MTGVKYKIISKKLIIWNHFTNYYAAENVGLILALDIYLGVKTEIGSWASYKETNVLRGLGYEP